MKERTSEMVVGILIIGLLCMMLAARWDRLERCENGDVGACIYLENEER